MDARELLLELAAREGFAFARIAGAEVLHDARRAAQQALTEGRLADLGWMTEEWLERATDPGVFLEGAQSVLMVALPYAPSRVSVGEGEGRARGRIAAYAAGRDYHRVFEKKLRRLARTVREELQCGARPTVDYGPLLERPLAAVAGMGWIGRSTMLLVPGAGPYVLLGAVATTLEVAADPPLRKTCGACTRCVEACPTDAISVDGRVDARLCISYHTIENRGPIPRELRGQFGDWIFGCDVCLDVCPPGFKHVGGAEELAPASEEERFPELAPLLELSEEEFRERYRGRAITRAKRDGFVRNVCIAVGNAGDAEVVPALVRALEDASALVRGHAAWALGELGRRLPSAAKAVGDALAARTVVEADGWVRAEIEAACLGLVRNPGTAP